MMVAEELYSTLYPRRIFTLDEAIKVAQGLTEKKLDRPYVSSKYLDSLLKVGKLERVRKGLYVVVSPGGEVTVDKLLVASKIREEGFLGFHAALEYYGCAYSATREAYICVRHSDRFQEIHYRGLIFKPVYVEDVEFEVIKAEYLGHTIRVAGKERLFIDCVSKPKYAGGWEECLKSLEGLGGLDFVQLISILEAGYGGQTAVRRVGLVLEMLKEASVFYRHLPDAELGRVESQVSKGNRYLVTGEGGRLNSRWRLIVPEGFSSLLIGV
jgi:predicted transcriptional regulator of viral defense system